MLVRSLAVQGSWNYRTLLGAGLAFVLSPALARVYREDPDGLAGAVSRHAGLFNCHPYLATIAAGALTRLEWEGVASGEQERFKRALVGPLGTLGDRLVWARWRPICALLAIGCFAVGAPWWVACGAALLSYNTLHIGLRHWGLRLGWREGREVGRALLGSPLRRLPDRLTIPLAVVSGVILPPLALLLADGTAVGSFPILTLAGVLTAAGFWRPTLIGRAVPLAFVLAGAALTIFG